VVDFILHMDPEYYHEARAYPAEFESKFKLSSTHKTTNMVAFDTKGVLRKFNTVGDILEEFFVERRRMYGIRKEHELERMRKELVELNARLVFVKAVVEKRLVVANAEDVDLLAGLKSLALPPLSAPEEPSDLKAYEYLLKMRVDRLKATAVAALEKEVAEAKALMERLEATSIEALWLQDLDVFETAWTQFVERRDAAFEEALKEGAETASKKVIKKPRAPAVKKVKV
jgi:DNA topoisomerase-2